MPRKVSLSLFCPIFRAIARLRADELPGRDRRCFSRFNGADRSRPSHHRPRWRFDRLGARGCRAGVRPRAVSACARSGQAANAAALAKSGGAIVVPQNEFTPERLAEILRGALAAPARLEAARRRRSRSASRTPPNASPTWCLKSRGRRNDGGYRLLTASALVGRPLT